MPYFGQQQPQGPFTPSAAGQVQQSLQAGQQQPQNNFWHRLMAGLAAQQQVGQRQAGPQSQGQDIADIIHGLVKLFKGGQAPANNAPTPGLGGTSNYDGT